MTTDPKNQAAAKAADTDRSIHLSASAGSGKTRALKERYLALLDKLDLRGLNIDQAVAITFTDKAAAEIKERIMHDLPDAMLKKIIRGRQDLRISTIHSFCMNLLKRYPLEAGLPPDFGVLDARDQVYKIRKSIEDSLEEADRSPSIMEPLSAFTADELVESIEFLLSIRSRLKRVEIDAKGSEGMLQAVQAGMDRETIEAELSALVGSPAWRALFMQMELLLRSQSVFHATCKGSAHLALASASDAHTVYRIAVSLMPIYFTQKNEPRKKLPIAKSKFRSTEMFTYPVYETLCSQVIDALAQFRSAYHRAQAGNEAVSLLQLYLLAEERYQRSKLREGLLDFDDLEIYAYQLLQGLESPEILYWLDRKILHFLVDEFQDTSDIQWAILNKLTEEIFAGQGTEKRMAPTLFVVGDEKQSIYRFREANYRLIRDIQGKMETLLPPEAREILTLHMNYRSTPAIIETVNRVFTALWGEAYQPSDPDRKDHAGSVRLIELPAEVRDNGQNDRHAPQEAAILAQEIRLAVDSSTMIYEKTGDAWNKRAATFGDCAILIQSRTKLKEYEAALQEADVPFRVVGGIGFYEEDEIQAMLNVLFFLWNRDDKLSLVAALRSPLFNMTDNEILELMRDNRDLLESLKEQRPEAWRLIHDWERNAGLAPLSVLLHRIIADTGAYVRFGRRNAQAIFNLDKLLDTARDFDRRGYTTLQDFVEWIRNIREAEQREATADMNLPGFTGAVSIMTVHKAKGLEFPIVFLPALNQQPRSVTNGPLAIVENSRSGLRLAIKDGDNPLYDDLWEHEKQELKREHQRLLYVAMTRARDCLVMIGTLDKNSKPFKESAWLNYLHQAIPVITDQAHENGPGVTVSSYPEWQAEVLPVRPAGAFQQERKEETPDTTVDAQTILDTIAPVPSSTVLEWRTATDFLSPDREDATELSLEKNGNMISPLTRGSIFHRCLEEHTKTGNYDLDPLIEEYPEMHALSPEMRDGFAVDVDAVLKKVLAVPAFAWIFERLDTSYSELPFICRRGQTLISGIMDRVVIQGDIGYVIDYKAIDVHDETEAVAWKNHYQPQVLIYCEAVKELFRLRRVEGLLLFLDSARLEPIVSA